MTLPAATLPPLGERITGATTLGRMILSASERGGDVALRYPPRRAASATISYEQLGERAQSDRTRADRLGIDCGDVVSILCSTRAEWTVCEAGALCAGAVIAPGLPHQLAGGVPARARALRRQAGAVRERRAVREGARRRGDCPRLEHVVVIEGEADGAITLRGADRRGRGGLRGRRSRSGCARSTPTMSRRSSTPRARPARRRAAR